jgi:hypothetical protein
VEVLQLGEEELDFNLAREFMVPNTYGGLVVYGLIRDETVVAGGNCILRPLVSAGGRRSTTSPMTSMAVLYGTSSKLARG